MAGLKATASLTPQSQPEKPAERNSVSRGCTRVIGCDHATAIAVCKAGPFVAFHFQTALGERIITAPESEFQKCRAAKDHNGNPFSAPVEHITAADLPPPAPKVRRAPRKFALTPAREAAFQRVHAIATNPATEGRRDRGVAAACRREGLALHHYYHWLTTKA